MKLFNVSICGLLFLAFFATILLHTSTQESFSLGSPRCSSICRRNEESLCKRCLFREPMRFGKRAGNFREPMRFGKKADTLRDLMQVGKREFREPMRFGKREKGEILGPVMEDLVMSLEAPSTIWNGRQQPEPSLGAGISEELTSTE